VDELDPIQSEDPEERDGAYADGRLVGKTYLSRSFDLPGTPPGTPATPARFVYKVLDQEAPTHLVAEGSEWTIHESPKGRVQIKLLMTHEPGHVSHFWIQRIQRTGTRVLAKEVFSLRHDEAQQLIELLKNAEHIAVEGGTTERIDDDVLRDLVNAPESLRQLYRRDRGQFFDLIANDDAARDVVALARRRKEVERFRRLLDDVDYFEEAKQQVPGHRGERVWQDFFEANPWILGTGLSGQFFSSWDDDKLEQVVGGASIVQEGKRVDALMRTSGVVRWLTFAEFKTHQTQLLGPEYRPGAWPPHQDLVGGVAQAQATVNRAVREIGDALPKRADDGSVIPDDLTYLTRPRSYLLAGHLDQLLGDEGGPHVERIRSFELYRRSLAEPEIITYDELLARAEWMVSWAENTDSDPEADSELEV
jgi:hypothetical protein